MMPKISTIKYSIQEVSIHTDFNDDIKSWLEEKAKVNGLRWLLAHADDGVVWGEVCDDGLHLSNCLFGPDLRSETLQMARLFGETGELYLWRADGGWRSRLLKEGEGKENEYYDESQLLWGTEIEDEEDGFILLQQGAEGLRHAPPIHRDNLKLPLNDTPLQLNIRHFVEYDEDGQAYAKFSRLISVGQNDKKE